MKRKTDRTASMLPAPEEIYQFRYDYTTCMVMKLPLAYPEPKHPGTSHVIMTFSQALECIRKIDAVTQGILKIYYLVGWQYLGHDDKYPDFFEVNEALCIQGKTARDSLLWLHEQAKQYHSVVSIHINFNDAYEDAPSFPEFQAQQALIRKRNGLPRAIERYNGKPCYKTCFKGYWTSGLFEKQIDRLLNFLPFLQECGTVHVDNFQCYHNYSPSVSIREMQDYRRRMIAFLHEKGIDITSEFTYKEEESLPNRKLFGLPREHRFHAPMDTLGIIPVSWWCTRMTREEYIAIPPQLYGGGMYKDKRYSRYLYGNMHGEDIIRPDHPDWVQEFLHQFATVQIPYHFLCQHQRLRIDGYGANERCIFSDGIISRNRRQTITWHGDVLKEKDTLFLPIIQHKGHWIAYSKKADSRQWTVKEANAKYAGVYRITERGNEFLFELPIAGEKLPLHLRAGEALLVVFTESPLFERG